MSRSIREASSAPRLGPRRVFVECTQTLSSSEMRGIPRVVRNLVQHGRRWARRHAAEVVPVRFQADRFVRVATTATDELPRQRRPPRSRIRRAASRLAKRVLSSLGTQDGAPVAFRPGDVLLLPDSSWRIDFWAAIDGAREAGASLGVIQHDFIPLRHPHLVPPGSPKIFQAWMHATLSRADFVLAVSETVAGEARDALSAMGRPFIAQRCVAAFRNGGDFTPPIGEEAVRPELARFLADADGGPFLTVGKVEPRKNQRLLGPVIERVVAADPRARLLIVGGEGWGGAAELAPLRRLPGWGHAILHVADLTDFELDIAYRRAKALVFPSLAEGYGLPIVEALARGTKVFASGLDVHREVGCDWCVYFDPHDHEALAAHLIGLSLHGTYPALWPAVDLALPTWEAAVGDILTTALRHAQRRPASDHHGLSTTGIRPISETFSQWHDLACRPGRAA